MELPRRIVDGGAGDFERQVLLSGALDVPSRHFRKRLARRLGLWVGATAVAGTSAASAKALGVGLLLKWLGTGVIAGVVVSGLSFGIRLAAERAPTGSNAVVRDAQRASARDGGRASSSSPATSRASGDARIPPVRSFEIPKRSAQAEEALPSAATDVARRSERLPEPPALAASAKTRLAVEMTAIDEIRAALAERDPALAMKRIVEYEHLYPAGLLSLEAEVLRIEALAALGKRGEVDRRSRRFLAEHPDSPYVGRVRSLLEGKAETSW